MADRYRYVCHTCGQSDVVDGLSRAQERFTHHAERGCEVVLRNVRPDGSGAVSEASSSDCRLGESRAADE